MKKQLWLSIVLVAMAGTSNVSPAADLPVGTYTPPPVIAPFTWTGLYLGGNIGGAWAQHNVSDSLLGLNFSQQTSNGVFIGGGQLGFNYQFGPLVLGVEGDF